ncbi:type 2 lantipeptide synthetase LanM [Nostoc sp. FACHB-152]|uniref:type 2 lanthipeptide synthetase LanM family protein n=1 Tax=unclassified Nostoc TaxID=2593658 RepID=UPI0016844DED|nr:MULTISPECIES: type 2 lanthipeptide synthetase LanM family protein [unclassified Nostoc]MBD2449030.1 type 2 lantipeptide synthetase LanM [Nostoc sp. FACHB-152]MBD2469761.1 type 2 lantipeptide synthetase LanM [Nostoc sp. FACHB-145]
MQITNSDLIKIVEQASTINERLGMEFITDKTQNNNELVKSRLENWCHVVAQGNKELFEQRLAWDGLDVDRVSQILGSVRLVKEQDLPAWTETFKSVLEATNLVSLENLEKGISSENRCLNPQEPLPFEELLLPFIYVARKQILNQVNSNYHLLSDEAHAALERGLLHSLVSLCSEAMGLNFLVFRTYQQPKLTHRLAQIQSANSRQYYSNFLRDMLAGGLLTFFQEYSVLARLAATVTDFWVDSNSEFIQRLASDMSDIQATFQSDGELGQVIAVNGNLSDFHHNGRSVIQVAFASGLKVVYKPKDLGSEEAYFQLLAWLNEQQIPLKFKVLQVLNRSTHGWVEYVEYLPCEDLSAAKRCYQRAGMLLCLLYLLEATDCHAENIIACGEYPVFIDMETLMSHQVRDIVGDDINVTNAKLATQQMMDSLLRIGFLPTWNLGPDGVIYDGSGLGGVGGQETNFRVRRWQHINTDKMALGYESMKPPLRSNIPSIGGVTLSSSQYVTELVDGFRQMYEFLIAHKETLLAANSSLTKLANQRVRFVFRPTQVYGNLLKQTLQPKFLQNGVERSIALDVLSRSLLKAETKPQAWAIIAAEQQALAQLDIPLFATRSNSDALPITNDCTIEKYFTQPSYDLVIARLQKLNFKDLAQQMSFIHSSLYARSANMTEASSVSVPSQLDFDAVSPLAPEALVQQAVSIAKEMQQTALRAADGSITWMGLEYVPDAQRFQLQPMSYDLYDGSYGVAMFLAALAKVTGDAAYKEMALGAVQQLRQVLQGLDYEAQQQKTKHLGIGGAKGLGSIVYTLVQSSQFLQEHILLKDAQQAAALITPANIASDRKFDIVSGAAGAILGLLSLYSYIPDPVVLEQAVTCGYHLINHRSVSSSGYRAWATLDEKLLTGFSHGAAGIAYALLRLYAVTQDTMFLAAADEAIAYENSVFSPTAQNWPDFRGDKPVFIASWCHGAPGIALARLGSLNILDNDGIRQDIDIALQTTQKFAMHDIDHLCCGNFGRMDVLLVAARQLQRPELLEIVQKQAAWAVNRAEKTGSYQLFSSLLRGTYNPGFFQGTSGIGYELLRLAYPNLLPSALLWE